MNSLSHVIHIWTKLTVHYFVVQNAVDIRIIDELKCLIFKGIYMLQFCLNHCFDTLVIHSA